MGNAPLKSPPTDNRVTMEQLLEKAERNKARRTSVIPVQRYNADMILKNMEIKYRKTVGLKVEEKLQKQSLDKRRREEQEILNSSSPTSSLTSPMSVVDFNGPRRSIKQVMMRKGRIAKQEAERMRQNGLLHPEGPDLLSCQASLRESLQRSNSRTEILKVASVIRSREEDRNEDRDIAPAIHSKSFSDSSPTADSSSKQPLNNFKTSDAESESESDSNSIVSQFDADFSTSNIYNSRILFDNYQPLPPILARTIKIENESNNNLVTVLHKRESLSTDARNYCTNNKYFNNSKLPDIRLPKWDDPWFSFILKAHLRRTRVSDDQRAFASLYSNGSSHVCHGPSWDAAAFKEGVIRRELVVKINAGESSVIESKINEDEDLVEMLIAAPWATSDASNENNTGANSTLIFNESASHLPYSISLLTAEEIIAEQSNLIEVDPALNDSVSIKTAYRISQFASLRLTLRKSHSYCHFCDSSKLDLRRMTNLNHGDIYSSSFSGAIHTTNVGRKKRVSQKMKIISSNVTPFCRNGYHGPIPPEDIPLSRPSLDPRRTRSSSPIRNRRFFTPQRFILLRSSMYRYLKNLKRKLQKRNGKKNVRNYNIIFNDNIEDIDSNNSTTVFSILDANRLLPKRDCRGRRGRELRKLLQCNFDILDQQRQEESLAWKQETRPHLSCRKFTNFQLQNINESVFRKRRLKWIQESRRKIGIGNAIPFIPENLTLKDSLLSLWARSISYRDNRLHLLNDIQTHQKSENRLSKVRGFKVRKILHKFIGINRSDLEVVEATARIEGTFAQRVGVLIDNSKRSKPVNRIVRAISSVQFESLAKNDCIKKKKKITAIIENIEQNRKLCEKKIENRNDKNSILPPQQIRIGALLHRWNHRVEHIGMEMNLLQTENVAGDQRAHWTDSDSDSDIENILHDGGDTSIEPVCIQRLRACSEEEEVKEMENLGVIVGILRLGIMLRSGEAQSSVDRVGLPRDRTISKNVLNRATQFAVSMGFKAIFSLIIGNVSQRNHKRYIMLNRPNRVVTQEDVIGQDREKIFKIFSAMNYVSVILL